MSTNPPNTLNGHLHYGGSLSRRGKLGAKPQKGNAFRSQQRFETIIRLENAAFPDAAIAAMLYISVPRLQTIKKSPDYLVARIQLTHGIILDRESKLADIKTHRREILTQLLPPALQVIAEEMARPATTFYERKHKLALAQDILDREGMFAKISKTEIKPVDSFDFERADAESAAVIAAIKGVGGKASGQKFERGATRGDLDSPLLGHHTEDTVRANEEFSNSRTLSAEEQQKALDDLEKADAELLLDLPSETEKIQ